MLAFRENTQRRFLDKKLSAPGGRRTDHPDRRLNVRMRFGLDVELSGCHPDKTSSFNRVKLFAVLGDGSVFSQPSFLDDGTLLSFSRSQLR